MKPSTALLAASLLANAALVAVHVTRAPASAPATGGSSADPRAAESATSGTVNLETLRAALASGDTAALVAAGLSPEAARELTVGRAFIHAAERIRAARANQPADERWWRNRGFVPGSRELQLQTRREMSDALVAAFGDDLGLFSAGDPSQLAFLPPEKRDALRRITQDYDEMMAKFSAGGVQLASDRERLKLLRAERDRDIAALLTPAEREAYELRTSATANAVRARYGAGIETEEDFKKIYALQKALEEDFPLDPTMGRVSPETMRERAAAQRQMQEDIRAALGDEKFAALRRATDSDLRTVDSLVSRLDLPSTTTDRVVATRDALAAESQRINADTSLTPQQRRAQIQDLGSRAKADLTQALGSEAADAYAQRSPWLNMLQNGMAYTTTPPADSPGAVFGAGQSVHPVFPAGAAGPGNTRQGITIATPMIEAAPTDVVYGSSGVQVMTFGTSMSETAAGAAPSGPRVIVGPDQPAPTPKR